MAADFAKRKFNMEDQKAFGLASGDVNPMHMDALFARRTQAGAPVVHGIHLLLWALESLASADPHLPELERIEARFQKFVYVDENVALQIAGDASAKTLTIISGGQPTCDFTLTFGETSNISPPMLDLKAPTIQPQGQPIELSLDQMSEQSGNLAFKPTDAISQMFPAASNRIGVHRVATLAASSNLVGMVCPGLHSIYSSLTLNTYREADEKPSLAYQVTMTSPLFRVVQMQVKGGGLTGTIQSFARMPPVQQLSMEDVRRMVGPQEFAGSTALVIGGSRGLGELTAKLVAAGGGKVIISYRVGREDAEATAQDIRSQGGRCEIVAYDSLKGADQIPQNLAPTHLYYYASPAIGGAQPLLFEQARFEAFSATYVDSFWRLIQTLQKREPRLSIFYPSTVFVAERPKGMTEYAMAKAAGETLCADINENFGPLHITVSRLPKLATDQTASIVPTETPPAVEVILPIVREVQSWPRS